ncbi:MAG TPA: ABC transporter permease [Thermodesulfobacteriota bacterium]|nr:ABC transporter permease [Thermodesulfobacteriota bacterium]
MKRKIILLTVFYLLLIAIWEGVASLRIWPSYLFPSPLSVVRALVAGFQDNSFTIGILESMKRVLIGYGLSIAGGVLIGLAIGRVKVLDETVGTIVLGFQALPSICWLPIALLWFGLSESAIVLVVVLGSLFAITIGVDSGVKNVPPIYLRAARTMGAGGIDLYTKVIIPAALPSIISGLKQGWSFAWRALMAGELLYVSIGLGHLLTMGRELNDISQIIAVMIIIIVIGIAVDRFVFTKLENRVRERWGLINA